MVSVRFYSLVVAAMISSSGMFTEAYYLDMSCQDARYMSTVVDGMANAFELASIAASELLTRPWTSPEKLPFAALSEYTLADRGLGGWTPAPPPPVPDVRPNLDKALDAFRAILTGRALIPKPPGADLDLSGNVEVFCNLDRYKSTKKIGRYWNALQKTFVWVVPTTVGAKPEIAMCNSLFKKKNIMAISWDGYEKQPAVIQICPWYLNEVSKAEFKTAKNQRTPLTVENDATPGQTHMDKFAMFDFTLLHELGHALGGVDHAIEHYGWTEVRALATVSSSHAIRNAESIAFLALGIRMLKNQHLEPNSDGSVTQRS